MTFDISLHEVCVRVSVIYVITKFSRMDSLPNVLTHGAPQARVARARAPLLDLVTVFDAILTSRQTCEKLQCLYENLMPNKFRKTRVLKKISIVN